MVVLTSLILDLRRVSYMIEHRESGKIEDIVEAFVFIVTQSVCSYRIYLVIWHKEKQRCVFNRNNYFRKRPSKLFRPSVNL